MGPPSKPSVNVPADSGSTPDAPRKAKTGVTMKFTNKKGKEIQPSNMGIQKLREFLELAKMRGNLTQSDDSEYTKAMAAFKASAGNPAEKAKQLKTMRAIYKRNRSV